MSSALDLATADLDRLLALERDEAIARAREGLLAFVLYTMPSYDVNWHHVLMARALNRFERGECKRLIITTPPRHGKSQLVSRHLPGYMLGRQPDMEIIASSYGGDLAQSMSRDAQRIILEPSYRDVFPHTILPSKGNSSVGYARTVERFDVIGHRGKYQSTGIGGSATGRGADRFIIDDYLRNAQDASSPTIRQRQWEWYTAVAYTRISKGGGICITATRWHMDDLVGRLLTLSAADPTADQWEVINLPAIAEGDLHPEDPRKIGDPLWRSRYDLPFLNKTQAQSPRVFVSLYQGRPSPQEGGVFKRAWWKFYKPAELPPMDRVELFCDLTFKDKEKDDWNVYLVLGAVGANRYALHRVRIKAAFTKQVAAFEQVCAKYPELRRKCVEDAANGAALIDHLKKRISGIVAIVPRGSKLGRAEAVSAQVEAGNVFLPHPDTCAWTEEFIQEHTDFPNGANDDQVDALSMGLAQMEKNKLSGGFSLYSETKASMWNQ